MRVPEAGRRRAMILMLALVTSVVLSTVLAPQAAAGSGYRGRVLRMVNATRENYHLHQVRIDTSLSRKAMHHTRQMIERNAIYDPTNLSSILQGEPWDSVGASIVGCAGTLRSLHRAFMHDAVHRDILLDQALRRIGIGVVKVDAANAC